MRRSVVIGLAALASLSTSALADANIKLEYNFSSLGVTQNGDAQRISSALGGEIQGEYEIETDIWLTAHYSISMADVSHLMLYGYGLGARFLVLGRAPVSINETLNEYSYSPGYNIGVITGMLRRDFDFRAFDDPSKSGKLNKGVTVVTQGDFWAPYLGVEANYAIFGSVRGCFAARYGIALFGELKGVKINVVSALAGIEVQL